MRSRAQVRQVLSYLLKWHGSSIPAQTQMVDHLHVINGHLWSICIWILHLATLLVTLILLVLVVFFLVDSIEFPIDDDVIYEPQPFHLPLSNLFWLEPPVQWWIVARRQSWCLVLRLGDSISLFTVKCEVSHTVFIDSFYQVGEVLYCVYLLRVVLKVRNGCLVDSLMLFLHLLR